jgi:hypothetical protein
MTRRAHPTGAWRPRPAPPPIAPPPATSPTAFAPRPPPPAPKPTPHRPSPPPAPHYTGPCEKGYSSISPGPASSRRRCAALLWALRERVLVHLPRPRVVHPPLQVPHIQPQHRRRGPQAPGSFRTTSRLAIGQARMGYHQGHCSHRRADTIRGGVLRPPYEH